MKTDNFQKIICGKVDKFKCDLLTENFKKEFDRNGKTAWF